MIRPAGEKVREETGATGVGAGVRRRIQFSRFMEQNRRAFSQGLAAAPLFIPSAVRGANDRPAFGITGVGNRGRWLHQTFQKLGAQCVAVRDVYEPTL
jgi:hypothetical protein